jgi:hypothetical protein
MKMCVKVLKFLSPKRELERMEMREATQRVAAHALDLAFTTEKLCNGGLTTAGGKVALKPVSRG